jgi:hypothetical protein
MNPVCYLIHGFSKIFSNNVLLSTVGLPSGIFLSGLENKIMYVFLIFSLLAACSAHLVLFDLINLLTLVEGYYLRIDEDFHYAMVPITSSFLVPNIFLSTLFLITLNLHALLNTRNQVSHPFETKIKNRVLNIYIYMLYRSCETRNISVFEFSLLLISS